MAGQVDLGTASLTEVIARIRTPGQGAVREQARDLVKDNAACRPGRWQPAARMPG